MEDTRITTRLIWGGMMLHLLLWLALHLPAYLGFTQHHFMGEAAIRTTALCTAYALALLLNLRIAGEYKNAPWLRLAWMALAGNAGFSVLRILAESQLFNLLAEGYTRSSLHGLLQHLAIVPANALLLLGLLAMWQGYHRVGLGFTIERRDYAAVVLILGLMAALLVFREGLSEARSSYLTARYLQQSGLILLSLCAATSVVLHRVAVQMGGGKLAVTLKFLAFYALLRAVLVLIQAWFRLAAPELNNPLGTTALYLDICWQAAPWLATLAAAYRAELTTHAARELAQYRAARSAMVSLG